VSGSPFLAGADVRVAGVSAGPLAGLAFAADRRFDVAGQARGGVGMDVGADRSMPPRASAHAAVVQRLLDQGATLAGRTVGGAPGCGRAAGSADPGAPRNPAAPDRMPGGSSGGAAAAVAGGLVDFAIGTDTGGGVRLPAALCGVYAMRPTHGAIALAGCAPDAPGFDTCGWCAYDSVMLARVGDALLPLCTEREPGVLLLAGDALALCTPAVRAALADVCERLGATRPVRVYRDPPADAVATFRTLSARERQCAGAAAPDAPVSAAAWQIAERARRRIVTGLGALLAGHALLLLPTTHDIAPPLGSAPDALAAYGERALALTSLASLAGAPQLSIPVGIVDGAPVGLSLVGAPGSDRMLLACAQAAAARLGLRA
jgi:amidase